MKYALVATPTWFPDAVNCGGMAPIGPLLADNDIPPASFVAELEAALAMWSAAINVTFVPAAETDADILIGAQIEPRGRAFTNVALDRLSLTDGVRRMEHALICLNPLQPWKIGFDGDLGVYDLRYTLAHEIGHAIGLDHPRGDSQVMGFRYLEAFSGLQSGDLAGGLALYGPAQIRQAQVGAVSPGLARMAHE